MLIREHTTFMREYENSGNGLHPMQHVIVAEDESRIRKDSGLGISSVFRRRSFSILKQDTLINDNGPGKRLTAGCDSDKPQGMMTTFQLSRLNMRLPFYPGRVVARPSTGPQESS